MSNPNSPFPEQISYRKTGQVPLGAEKHFGNMNSREEQEHDHVAICVLGKVCLHMLLRARVSMCVCVPVCVCDEAYKRAQECG